MKEPDLSDFDIIIAGGGMVGATTALALAKIKAPALLKIAIVESVNIESESSSSFDDRAVALSAASVAIYQSLDVWRELEPIAEPINDIHISEQHHFGFTRLSSKDYPLDALGQVIPLNETGPVLWGSIRSIKSVTVFCPDKISAIDSTSDAVSVKLKSLDNKKESTIRAKLLIAADGTFSEIAEMANLPIQRTSYHQHAVIANISTDKPHNNKAFERFTQQGPLALLPLTRNRMSLVWCQNDANIKQILKLSDNQFIRELQHNFGFRLGKITKVGTRSSYPLALHLPKKCFSNRTLLLGNSAHTLHPIAGQGFNIGLRDIAALVDAVTDSLKNNEQFDLGSEEFLANYENQRKPDWQRTIGATDSLVRIFSNDFFPLESVRSKALWFIDKIPFIKNKIANGAMGFSGESARLTRGLE